MKISNKTDYAIRTVVDLARNRGGHPVTASEIAARQNIPRKFLEQILTLLRTAGFIESVRGAQGGYLLTRRPADIHLDEIVRATEPDILSHEPGSAASPLDLVWQEISDGIETILHNVTIRDVCRRADEFAVNQAVSYTI